MAHHAGELRDATLDEFLSQLDAAQAADDAAGDPADPEAAAAGEAVEVGAIGHAFRRGKAARGGLPQACSLVAELLPPPAAPGLDVHRAFFDPMDVLKVRQQEFTMASPRTRAALGMAPAASRLTHFAARRVEQTGTPKLRAGRRAGVGAAAREHPHRVAGGAAHGAGAAPAGHLGAGWPQGRPRRP